ncbi:MAG: hypothetical protein JWQ02_930 [Capsulimonas sp.]|jgi:hypothetical protein|nr:hypothetical protein [Capsulimonas sp.]
MAEYHIERTVDRLTLRLTREAMTNRVATTILSLGVIVWIKRSEIAGFWLSLRLHPDTTNLILVVLYALIGLCWAFPVFLILARNRLFVFDRNDNSMRINGARIYGLDEMRVVAVHTTSASWVPQALRVYWLDLYLKSGRSFNLNSTYGTRKSLAEFEALAEAINDIIPEIEGFIPAPPIIEAKQKRRGRI